MSIRSPLVASANKIHTGAYYAMNLSIRGALADFYTTLTRISYKQLRLGAKKNRAKYFQICTSAELMEMFL